MVFQILDPKENVVATAETATEALVKFRAGRGLFGRQKILDPIGAPISEAELEVHCQKERSLERGDE